MHRSGEAPVATLDTVHGISIGGIGPVTPVDSYGCPVARTAQIMGNKWTPLIVRDLADGQRRFSELERSLTGISPKTLSERLKRLEEAHVLERRCFAEVPPRVEYSLTPKGHALLPVIESMREFGLHWLNDEDCDEVHSAAADCSVGD